jgi:hypothetical protein
MTCSNLSTALLATLGLGLSGIPSVWLPQPGPGQELVNRPSQHQGPDYGRPITNCDREAMRALGRV